MRKKERKINQLMLLISNFQFIFICCNKLKFQGIWDNKPKTISSLITLYQMSKTHFGFFPKSSGDTKEENSLQRLIKNIKILCPRLTFWPFPKWRRYSCESELHPFSKQCITQLSSVWTWKGWSERWKLLEFFTKDVSNFQIQLNMAILFPTIYRMWKCILKTLFQ